MNVVTSAMLAVALGVVPGAAASTSAFSAAAAPAAAVNDVVAPSVPEALHANVHNAGTLLFLTWAPSADNEGGSGLDEYEVFKNGERVGTVRGEAAAMPLTLGEVSTFTVRAIDKAGNVSAFSEEIIPKVIDDIAPSIPGSLKGEVDATGTAVKLTWARSGDNAGGTGIGHYMVYKGDRAWQEVDASASSTIMKIKQGEVASFTIVSIDKAGNPSEHSNAVTVDEAGNVSAVPNTPALTR